MDFDVVFPLVAVCATWGMLGPSVLYENKTPQSILSTTKRKRSEYPCS